MIQAPAAGAAAAAGAQPGRLIAALHVASPAESGVPGQELIGLHDFQHASDMTPAAAQPGRLIAALQAGQQL